MGLFFCRVRIHTYNGDMYFILTKIIIKGDLYYGKEN